MTDTDLLTIPDVMAMLGVSESTVRAMIRGQRPCIPYLRIGNGRGNIRFHRDDVRRYLDSVRVEAPRLARPPAARLDWARRYV